MAGSAAPGPRAAPVPAAVLRPRAGARAEAGLVLPRRRAEASILVPAEAVGIFAFEEFIEGLDFLEPAERDRMKLAGGEIFDNLVRHAGRLEEARIVVRAARRDRGPLLSFHFKSAAFASFAARCADVVPTFDRASRRWRGIGILMCRNLARSVVLRPGELVDRIYLEF